MTTITVTTGRAEGEAGDHALLLVLAGVQRVLTERPERPRPAMRRVVRDAVEDLPPSVRPAVRPVLDAHGPAVERVLRQDPHASPRELLRRVRAAEAR